MNFEDIQEFQQGQTETTMKLGAFSYMLQGLIGTIDELNELALNGKINNLLPVINEFKKHVRSIKQFLLRYNYEAYSNSIISIPTTLAQILVNQSIKSSRKLELDRFKEIIQSQINEINSVMMAIAQLSPPNIDVNIKANNPFSAYCFINSLMKRCQNMAMVIDPYVDKTIFLRYLSNLPSSSQIIVVTDPDNLKGHRLAEFVAIETAFSAQYLNYKKKEFEHLHDRYLVVDGVAYTLGGSIKDAASKSDYSIVQLSEASKNEILQRYL